MTKWMQKPLLLLIGFLIPLMAGAQLEVSLAGSKDTVQIGEAFSLTVSIQNKSGHPVQRIEWAVLDSLGLMQYLFPDDSSLQTADYMPVDYEISDYGNWPPSGNASVQGPANGQFSEDPAGFIRNEIRMKLWDPGQFIILIKEIAYKSNAGEEELFYPEVSRGKILNVALPDVDAGTEDVGLLPVKDILREGWHWLDFKWLYLALILMVLVWWLVRKRPWKRKEGGSKDTKGVEVKRPAHEIALQKFRELAEQKPWLQGQFEEFQTRFSHILREYLENRYRIKALESTTREIIQDLEKEALNTSDVILLREMLEISDLVKFAKAKPGEDIHERFLTDATEFVLRTKSENDEKSESL